MLLNISRYIQVLVRLVLNNETAPVQILRYIPNLPKPLLLPPHLHSLIHQARLHSPNIITFNCNKVLFDRIESTSNIWLIINRIIRPHIHTRGLYLSLLALFNPLRIISISHFATDRALSNRCNRHNRGAQRHSSWRGRRVGVAHIALVARAVNALCVLLILLLNLRLVILGHGLRVPLQGVELLLQGLWKHL